MQSLEHDTGYRLATQYIGDAPQRIARAREHA